MSLTKAEQAWITENMKEDFIIGFSERLYFDDHNIMNNVNDRIPTEESESEGYFCMACRETKIPDAEEHAKMCMYFKPRAGDEVFILFTHYDRQWLSGPFDTIEKAVETAKISAPEGASIVRLLGSVVKDESRLGSMLETLGKQKNDIPGNAPAAPGSQSPLTAAPVTALQ